MKASFSTVWDTGNSSYTDSRNHIQGMGMDNLKGRVADSHMGFGSCMYMDKGKDIVGMADCSSTDNMQVLDRDIDSRNQMPRNLILTKDQGLQSLRPIFL